MILLVILIILLLLQIWFVLINIKIEMKLNNILSKEIQEILNKEDE
jgi:hypothetical protein